MRGGSVDYASLPRMPGAQSEEESDADEPVWGRMTMKRLSQDIVEKAPSLPVSRRPSLNGQGCAPRAFRISPTSGISDPSDAHTVPCTLARRAPFAVSARRASSGRLSRRRQRRHSARLTRDEGLRACISLATAIAVQLAADSSS